MTIATLSDFRGNIKRYFDNIIQNFETLVISRGKDKGIVMMSLQEYNSMKETIHLLGSENNAKRLFEAIARDKKGEAEQHNLLEE